MKTICFFSRLALVDLYGPVASHLSGHFNVVHLAYSSNEESILRDKYGINDIVNLKAELEKHWISESPSTEILKDIDELFIEQSNNRFSLNSAIRLDRTFLHLEYNDCLLLASNYFNFWKYFTKKYKVDVVFHEPPAVFMTHLLSNLCKKLNIYYLTQSQVYGPFKHNWILCEGDNSFPIEWPTTNLCTETNEDLKGRAVKFIAEFRANYTVFFSSMNRNFTQKNKSFIKFLFWVGYKFTIGLIHLSEWKKTRTDERLIDHYEWYTKRLKIPLILEVYNKWFEIFRLSYDLFDENDDYLYYPLHAEPEAAVLYRGDGIYESQIKLIENIAEQMPPNVYLYVKDHPHRRAFNLMVYTERLCRIPNVKLIDPSFSGKKIIFYSKGVITISGTSGFEAILFNKPVFLFGQSFYINSNRVFQIRNIRDLRESLYKSLICDFTNDDDILDFVSNYLQIVHEGFVGYFPSVLKKLKIQNNSNIEIVSKELKRGLNNIFKKPLLP